MGRLNIRQSLGRIGQGFRGRGSAAIANPVDRGYRGRRRWSLLIVGGVAVCMVLAVAGRANRFPTPAGPRLSPGDQTTGTVGQLYAVPTAMAAAPMAPEAQVGDRMAAQPDAYNKSTGVGGAAPQAQSQAQAQAQTQPWERMIVRTATLQLKVKDVAASLDQIRALAGAHDGIITQSDSHQEGDYTVATITLQVPSQEFDSVMTKVRAAGLKTIQENVSSSDVTEEYTDLQSQLRNLQATETRLLALQQKADKLEDILALDRELRQVQGDIERIQGRLNFLSKRSEMSTITVSLYPDALPVAPTVQTATGWNPVEIVQRAWFASLDLLAGVASAALTVAVFMWWAVPLLLLAAWLAIRPRRRTAAPGAPISEV